MNLDISIFRNILNLYRITFVGNLLNSNDFDVISFIKQLENVNFKNDVSIWAFEIDALQNIQSVGNLRVNRTI